MHVYNHYNDDESSDTVKEILAIHHGGQSNYQELLQHFFTELNGDVGSWQGFDYLFNLCVLILAQSTSIWHIWMAAKNSKSKVE